MGAGGVKGTPKRPDHTDELRRTPRRRRCQRGRVRRSEANPRASITHSHSDAYSLAVDKRRRAGGQDCPTARVWTLPRSRLPGHVEAQCASPPRSEEGLPGPAERIGACGRGPH